MISRAEHPFVANAQGIIVGNNLNIMQYVWCDASQRHKERKKKKNALENIVEPEQSPCVPLLSGEGVLSQLTANNRHFFVRSVIIW